MKTLPASIVPVLLLHPLLASGQLALSPSAECVSGMRHQTGNGLILVMSTREVPIGPTEIEAQARILMGGVPPAVTSTQGATDGLAFPWTLRSQRQDVTFVVSPQKDGAEGQVGVAIATRADQDDILRAEIATYVCRLLDAFGPARVRTGGELAFGELVMGQLENTTAVHRYTFSGRAGQTIVLDAAFLSHGEERGERISLRDPTGARLEHLMLGQRVELSVSGTHVIQVDQRSASAPTAYQIKLDAFNPAPEYGDNRAAPGGLIVNALEYRNDEDVFLVDLRRGQEVSVQLEALDVIPFTGPTAQVLRPEGTPRRGIGFSEVLATVQSGEGFSLPAQAETAGLYRIRIHGGGAGDYVGRYRLHIRVLD